MVTRGRSTIWVGVAPRMAAKVDQPWYRCTLEPTADFEAVRPLLEATGETEDEDRFMEVVEEMAARGVRLIWASGAAEPRPDLEGSLQLIGPNQIAFRPDHVRLRDGLPTPDIND